MIPGIMSSYQGQAAQDKYEGSSSLTTKPSESTLNCGAPSAAESIFVSVSQDPIKHTWALLTVMSQPVPYYIVSMYSVCPSFKILKFNYVLPEDKAYSLTPAALSTLWLTTTVFSTSA